MQCYLGMDRAINEKISIKMNKNIKHIESMNL